MKHALRCLTLCHLVACTSCGTDPELAFTQEGAATLRRAAGTSVLESGRAECDARELARLPDARSNAPSVRHYASVISQEHGTLFVGLQRLLRARGVELPYVMSEAGASLQDRLAYEAGGAFDRAYLAGQVQLQGEARKTLGELQGDRDGGMRGWAQEAAQVWERDEQWARQIYASILIDSGTDSQTEP